MFGIDDALAAGIISGGIAAVSGAFEGHKQRKADKQLLEAQNTYNSPANQMSRLQEAGLNPMLVYSGGNVTGNQSQLGTQNYAGSTGVSKGLESFMAVRNAGLDAQLKDQDILSKKVNNTYLDQQIQAQLHRVFSEDKILQAEARMKEAQARRMEHNNSILLDGNYGLTYEELENGSIFKPAIRNSIMTTPYKIGQSIAEYLHR